MPHFEWIHQTFYGLPSTLAHTFDFQCATPAKRSHDLQMGVSDGCCTLRQESKLTSREEILSSWFDSQRGNTIQVAHHRVDTFFLSHIKVLNGMILMGGEDERSSLVADHLIDLCG